MTRTTVSVLILALVLSVMSASALNIQLVKADPATWYVDDDGPADFSSIQEAIDSTLVVDGDTVIVLNGTYYENVVVDKRLNLIGQSKHGTIIDGSGVGNVIHILAPSINLTEFTIQGSGYDWLNSGIKVNFNGSTINQNIVRNNQAGIVLLYSYHNNVTSNIAISNTYNGIVLFGSTDNLIAGNVASNNEYGISLSDFSNDNTISGNVASDNTYGISFWYDSDSNRVIGNNASNNDNGIYIRDSKLNMIFHNNFIENTRQAVGGGLMNVWNDFYPSCGNYWSDYADQDLFIGPAQNQPGSDNIWDHPYVIDDIHQDKYPLVDCWTPSWIPPSLPPAGIFADLIQRKVWSEHHHYDISRDEDSYQTLYARIRNLGNQTAWVKAIFHIAHGGSSTIFESEPLLIVQGEIAELSANLGPLSEPDVGKYSVSAVCWFSHNKRVWAQGENEKTLHFNIVP